MNKSFLLILSLFMGQITVAYAQSPQINIYSFRKYELIKPVLERFEANSGIKVNLVNGKSHHLLTRLQQDGAQSQADVLLSSDLAQLHSHKSLLQKITNQSAWQNVSSYLFDEDGYWVSISMRTRALFSLQNNNNVKVPRYFSQLSAPQYQGQFCIRDWQHSYNAILSAALLTTGNTKDSDWLKLGNKLLAKRPSGGDRDQLRALAQNRCSLAFANHYYWHMMKRTDNKRDQMLAQKLQIHFLKTEDGLTPVSTTTAAIAKYSPNKGNAERFIAFLLTEEAQRIYAKSLHEFPVLKDMMTSHVPFKPNLKAVKQGLELLPQASQLLAR